MPPYPLLALVRWQGRIVGQGKRGEGGILHNNLHSPHFLVSSRCHKSSKSDKFWAVLCRHSFGTTLIALSIPVILLYFAPVFDGWVGRKGLPGCISMPAGVV